MLHRRLAIAPSLDRLIAYTADVFHGEVLDADTIEPRLLPGLQNDDCSGSAAFGSALTQACLTTADQAGEHPVMVTPHDLRASLNTDLENAGVDDRWLRHYFGHRTQGGKKLDVHDANYDCLHDLGWRVVLPGDPVLLTQALQGAQPLRGPYSPSGLCKPPSDVRAAGLIRAAVMFSPCEAP